MASTRRVYDSPRDWVREHIRQYIATGGRKGHRWNGYPTLLLTTRGRKTGRLRRTALIYGREGRNYVVIASYGGRPHHPQWYLNLLEHPDVEVQVRSKKITALARTAGTTERRRLWRIMNKIFPEYNAYQVKAIAAGREIPVVILEPA